MADPAGAVRIDVPGRTHAVTSIAYGKLLSPLSGLQAGACA